MSENKRKILVTSALPYANGDIHIGHLVEYLQTDFWVRFQKMRGHDCIYICADDTHGTPIMLKARDLGITPEELIAQSKEAHERDFAAFEIEFDNYGSTNAESNRVLSYEFYDKMKSKSHTTTREIDQLYCEHDKMFLPDRFVKGTCPNCKSTEQYGDSCDVCGATYAPTDMSDVHCAICGNIPVMRGSEHLFFKLNDFKSFLDGWVPDHTQVEINNKLQEWLAEDLRDWDISRDEPYFGFEIPDMPKKYFYVWVDAPVGYISSTTEWAEKTGRTVDEFWKDESSELYHFIGKDIVYFHTLFWPAMLEAAEYRKPTKVFVHGFLTVNGEKMSKSKGTFIKASTYLEHLGPEYLRYYYACKMSSSVHDIDLNLEDFMARINSDLVGKITNLGSRGAQMTNKKFEGRVTSLSAEGKELLQKARGRAEKITALYEGREFSKAVVEIREIADMANQYFDTQKPWELAKDNPEKTQEILCDILNLFRVIAIFLKPVLPRYVEKVEKLLGEEPYSWGSIEDSIENKTINSFEHLAKRIEQKQLDAMVESSKTQ